MSVRRWASVIALCFPLMIAVPLCGQQQSQSPQKQQSGQPAPSSQQNKTSTQDLPSAPLPQPTAGQTEPESPRPSPAAPPPAEPGPYGPTGPSDASEPPRAAPPDTPGASTSKDDRVDISPPANDATAHPDAGMNNPDISEFHPFDPHRAAKDVEVGDFYYKRRNYQAAISRYREALLYKPNDAIATFSLADALEKVGDRKEAVENYQAYLKILPEGPKAKDAHQALARLKGKAPAAKKPAASAKAATPAKQ
ncbi:MAG TPA: tetratricopeptide repeat protein [Terriglobales bacterium]|nr:tetratricopeptide repeat protein [Terriglobales bacterium]